MNKTLLREIKESARKSMLIEGYVVSKDRTKIAEAKKIVRELYSDSYKIQKTDRKISFIELF